MSHGTYSASYTSTVTLHAQYPQITITETAQIKTNGDALDGGAGTAYQMVNAGNLRSSYGNGVVLEGGGGLTNTVSGHIAGAYEGVVLDAAGTVLNQGKISGSYYGIQLEAGAVTNKAAGAVISGAIAAVLIETGIGTVVNSGTIQALTFAGGAGVVLAEGGSVSNETPHGHITGLAHGVLIEGATGTVTNGGTIEAGNAGIGIQLSAGTVTNSSTAGLITGGAGGVAIAGAGDITNAGTITASSGRAIALTGGGTVSELGTSSLIDGLTAGVYIQNGLGTVTNAGTIQAIGSGSAAVALEAGGSVANTGSLALIDGASQGVLIAGAAGTVVNSGTIGGFYSIALQAGGTVANLGSQALLTGTVGVAIAGGIGTVTNTGSITGSTGVILYAGGSVGNTGQSARIDEKFYGVVIRGGAGTVTNSGSIAGGYYPPFGSNVAYETGFGVILQAGGTVTNIGSASVISSPGRAAVEIDGGAGTVVNAGQITGYDAGILLTDGGSVVNGAGAYISGASDGAYAKLPLAGVDLTAGGSVANYGTIEGVNYSVVLYGPSTALTVGAGAAFFGEAAAKTAGATLAFGSAGGAGTLSGLGSGTLTGAVVGRFSGFATYVIDAGADWTLAGTDHLAAGTTLTDSGTLIGIGTLTLGGTIGGTGTLGIAGGTMILTEDTSFGGSVDETGGLLALAGQILTLTGSVDFAGGTIADGSVTTKLGTTTLTQLLLDDGAHWNNAGTVKDTGTLALGDATGAGHLFNHAGATFDIIGNGGIASASGSNFLNQGLFEKTAGGGLSRIGLAIDNGGTIGVTSGTLELHGAVTGTGRETIGAGAILQVDAGVADTQTITFAGGGDLVLHDASGNGLSFGGLIAGFGSAAADEIDLVSFGFNAATKLAWTQNSSGEGTLAVTDGAKSASLILFGQFVSADFHQAKHGGGTVITVTPPPSHGSIAVGMG